MIVKIVLIRMYYYVCYKRYYNSFRYTASLGAVH